MKKLILIEKDVLEALDCRGKINAIRMLKDSRNISLGEAKALVNDHQRCITSVERKLGVRTIFSDLMSVLSMWSEKYSLKNK
ncbi:MAG: hypothetical protein KUG80_07350 [Gammaproteobacteria bacterium]|nr:hypothetical protein [Gammaproteobacteria bacterium]